MAYTMEYPTKDLFHKWIDGNAVVEIEEIKTVSCF